MRLLSTLSAVLVLAFAGHAEARNPEQWKAMGWKTDFSKHSVPYTEIRWGGVRKDGIPSIDDPKFKPAKDISGLQAREPVIRVEVNGAVKAYPLQVLMWHEIANDTIGGVPVAVTYCPLCNSAIVFDRRLDGTVLEFGVSGNLRNSDMVMYDRQTESWWQQFVGKGIVGVHNGRDLKMLPSRVEAFEMFKKEHPNAPVLVPSNTRMRNYGTNPYIGYDTRPFPYMHFLEKDQLPKDIHPMARVIMVHGDTEPLAVTLKHVRKTGAFEKGDIHFSWTRGQASALDEHVIAKGRDVGNIRVSRKSANGKMMSVVHDITFAFVVALFYPELEIIGKSANKGVTKADK